MIVGIPREVRPGERRVAATPETSARLLKLGFEVHVQSGAGEGAAFRDSDYEEVGATIVEDAKQLWAESDIVLKVQPPEHNTDHDIHEADLLREGSTLICFLWPAKNKELIERLAARKASVLAMDQIPRITRAQKMDALSSMANIAGYRAVIEAASFFGRFFTGQMTAAGKVPPAKVMVIGAGVAGLAAIGAARGLGAIVRAFDTRPVVKEQVKSMGAEFLELDFKEDGSGTGGYAKQMSKEFLDAERELFLAQARDVDIIITTALIPGKPAPVLLDRDMVESMKQGSVIVDLAAEAGGNCELTQPEQVVTHNGVTIIGYIDLPSRLAPTASQLYGNNLAHLLSDMGGGSDYKIDLEDAVVRGAIVLRDGELLWPAPKAEEPAAPKSAPTRKQQKGPSVPPAAQAASAPAHGHGKSKQRAQSKGGSLIMLALAFGLTLLAWKAPPEFLSHLTVFVLACFVGWQVIWNVTPALHTPLMSVTNAISGIILIGGMLQISGPLGSPITILGAAAVLLATINVAGGFLVTQRMLRMFQR